MRIKSIIGHEIHVAVTGVKALVFSRGIEAVVDSGVTVGVLTNNREQAKEDE